ncbi:LacI family DNA-binding transcriptional regulator [Hespellia stercorisuis]|uniref:Transcriptional regulator, LacI family n=1 Tax=Hespellia stercorisuis DSM 15480 TaxID=1121950 RepID=A0A1M6QJJ8_9FIRM|nr:LacI family DNA-binding transcriptional regulator [Hespellia stercorisuis]SHK20449.1 transcriptional regulator, LacI family [Hespellia stercorisuis DSM 15480]
MRTTIKDIANHTGLSVTTISMVLNNKADSIPESTKEKVFKAVKELNYRPNQMAVGLVKRQSKTIGLILSDVSNSFFAMIAKAIEDGCHEHGWNLILCNTNNHHDREVAYIQALIDKSVDGIILCMARENTKKRLSETISILNENHIPFVMLDRFSPQMDCGAVIVNHELGGYLAGKYLLDMGHRRIGCITGPNDLADSNDRTKGFEKALKEYSMKLDPSLMYEGDYDIDGGEKGTEYLMKKGVTAIFAYNDLTAYGVYRYAGRIGKKIPDDFSVIGYDDVTFSEIITPPLTTIRQPVYDMGIEAVRQVIKGIQQGDGKYERIEFDPEIVIRFSVKQN